MADEEDTFTLPEQLEIITRKDYGRGLYVRQNLKKGDELLHSNDPIARVLCKEYRGLRCDNCLIENAELVKCSGCKFSYYCGKACQRNDWKYHKHECRCLNRVSPKKPTDLCRLVSRILFKYFLHESQIDHINQFVNCLIGNSELINQERKDGFNAISFMILEYIGEDSSYMDFTSHQLFEIICSVSCNCFTVTLEETESVGIALYSWPSYINHSCLPNAVITFVDFELNVHAIEDISSGQEIFISYIEQMDSYEGRQQKLMERYCFTCECELCRLKDDAETEKLFTALKCSNQDDDCSQPIFKEHGRCPTCYSKQKDVDNISIEMKEQHLIDAISCTTVDIDKQFMKLKYAIKEASFIFHSMNLSLVRANEKASDLAVTMQLYEDALTYSKQLILPYQKYCGNTKYHPMIGIEMYKIAKLESLLGYLQDAMLSFTEARDILSVTHGVTHPLYKSLLYHLQGIRCELSGPTDSKAQQSLEN